jgi:hypothetical protein
MRMMLQKGHISRHERPVAAPRLKVAVLAGVTGALLAAATPLALHLSASRRQTTLATAARAVHAATSESGGLAAQLRVLSITPASSAIQAGRWSTLRLEQLLAEMGYLPVTWIPRSVHGLPAQGGAGAAAASDESAGTAAGTPVTGAFSWQGQYPSALTSQWRPGRPGVILTGALMAFQADHGLPMTGRASRGLWLAVLSAVAHGQRNPHGYTYALAVKATPEALIVWHDGHVVVRGLANTGTAAAPTPDGTYPVYLRERSQVMRGLMPDGTPYADPVQFIAYYHGNYAVHSMDRASFGWPQSVGCVELPLREARRAWPYLTYGSLVTVTG